MQWTLTAQVSSLAFNSIHITIIHHYDDSSLDFSLTRDCEN
uniref:Uncharacterized protein n=1 Tax=Setaria italica TaxID=4555 RepID=K3XUI1_SETIT